jgi:aminopeptidase YwaD
MDITSLEKRILGELWTSPDLWNHMLALCDSYNSRFAGTEEERLAGDYIMDCFSRYGLENIHPELFEMPGWVRGSARLVLLDGSTEIEIPCLALPGTPACNLDAEIIDLGSGSPDDYAKLSEPAAGKIVLTNSEGLGRMEKYMAAVEAGIAAFIFGSDKPGMLAPTGSMAKIRPPSAWPMSTPPAFAVCWPKARCEHASFSPAPSKPSRPATSWVKSRAPTPARAGSWPAGTMMGTTSPRVLAITPPARRY